MLYYFRMTIPGLLLIYYKSFLVIVAKKHILKSKALSKNTVMQVNLFLFA